VPEADDDRVAEGPDAGGIRAEIAVVAAGGDRRDRRVAGVDLHEHDRVMTIGLLRERGGKGFCPATEVSG
jgi:hypothetical protein